MFYGLATLCLATSLASAAEGGQPSEPVIQSDATVRSEVVIAADIASVKAALADPLAAAKLCPDIVSARVIERGACDVVEISTRGMSAPLVYRVKRCPTADGFHETMVSSDDFDDVKIDWQLTAVQGGTRVTYSIRTLPDVPVPQRIISSLTAKSAVTTLKNLVLKVVGQ